MAEVVAVAATKTNTALIAARLLMSAAMLISAASHAAVLPEERADAMYHSYDGGGVTIDGPSVLVRKNFAETVSASANYYVDNISSASIDVVTSGASRYSEKRTEYSVGAQYLYDKSIISGGVTRSDESDYEAETWYVGVSQDFFGDLSNISFSYSRGDDLVRQTGIDDFEEEVLRQNFRIGFSQVIKANWIMSLNYELGTDEGYLNNPYRSYRYLNDPLDPTAGYQLAQEVYPNTRTSDAASLRMLYYLPWRAVIGGNYRYFSDDWGIAAHTAQISYTHTFRDRWVIDLKYRYYQQGDADFYDDLFQFASQDSRDYRARDKEMSDFDSSTLSLHVSYELPQLHQLLDRTALSLQWDHMFFNYNNFSNLTDVEAAPGEEKLYELEADVVKVLLSIWY